MKYELGKENGFLLIHMSGDTRRNEAVLSKEFLKPYLKEKGVAVIVDLKELKKPEFVTLLGVLNGIKKEIDFSRGGLRICSLTPELEGYFRENRLDQIFQIYGDAQKAISSGGKNSGDR